MFGKALGSYQNARFKMAEMRAQIEALQVFVDQCVLRHNEGLLTPETAAIADSANAQVTQVFMATSYWVRCAGLGQMAFRRGPTGARCRGRGGGRPGSWAVSWGGPRCGG